MTFQIMPVLATLWVTCSAQENLVSTVAVPSENNWVVGSTLDSFFEAKATPFTLESIQAFEDAFDNADFDYGDGQIEWQTDIVTKQDEKMESLGIDSSLSVSFMGWSVDAHMTFAEEEVHCESDVSFIFKASSSGKKKQLSLSDTNVLELRSTTKQQLVLDQFLETYGQYVIVGFYYGGEILFQSTHSAQTSTDKIAIEAGLGISFAEAGFDFSVTAGYNKSDISRSIESKNALSIRPNSEDEDVDDLIAVLADLSEGNVDADESLHNQLYQSTQNVLSGDNLDAVTAVLVPLTSLIAVNDHFADTADETDTAAFLEFLNGIYMKERALEKRLGLVEQEWEQMLSQHDGLSVEHPLPWELFGDWNDKLTKLWEEMKGLNTMEEIVNTAMKYNVMADDKYWNIDIMSADSFLNITADGMDIQFDSAIMLPYYAMLGAAPTPSPTQNPTLSPVGPIPVVDRGNIYSGGESCVGDLCLGECEGDCDSDDHCETGLICWYRDYFDRSLPPGCSGTAHNNNHDYCYDPEDNIETVNMGSNPSSDLGECQGDCDWDSDCSGSLKCWTRNNWNSNLPPGCKGSAFEESHDFCYDNTKDHSNALPPDDAPSARTAAFAHSMLKGSSSDSFIRHDDAIESGDYVFVLSSSALWMLAALLCFVFSALTAVMVCRGAKKKQYQVVAAMSDTDCV